MHFISVLFWQQVGETRMTSRIYTYEQKENQERRDRIAKWREHVKNFLFRPIRFFIFNGSFEDENIACVNVRFDNVCIRKYVQVMCFERKREKINWQKLFIKLSLIAFCLFATGRKIIFNSFISKNHRNAHYMNVGKKKGETERKKNKLISNCAIYAKQLSGILFWASSGICA